MNVKIEKGKAEGIISAPPSKSYGHRMMICAALAGEGKISGISGSEDMRATIDCIRALGVDVHSDKDVCIFKAAGGAEGELPVYKCRESGSTLRFFIPIALALTGGGVFTGSERLIERGIGIYEDIFLPRGIRIEKGEESITVRGDLSGGDYVVRGDVSSQFISGLLFALPLLSEDSTLKVTEPVESRAYIDITIDTIRKFGINIEETADNYFVIKGNQKYQPKEESVEGDWSNAAFLFAISKLFAKGEGLTVTGVNADSFQGDKVCVSYFDSLLKHEEKTLDISGCPDLGPILFAFAALSQGGSFTGIRRLRIKESDRAAVMGEVLSEFGIRTQIDENDMVVFPGELSRPQKPLSGYNDHRIVMSEAVLLLACSGEIEGAQACAKSYPTFFEDLMSIGIKVEKI